MENKQKVQAVVGSVFVGLAGLGGGFVLDNPEPIYVDKVVTQEKLVTVEVPVPFEQIVEVEKLVEVPVEVPVEIEVDSDNLQMVLDHIYDNDGKVCYLLDDLDDDEVDQIVERIDFINSAKKLAVDAVKDEGVDLLDKEEIDGEVLDEDDIDRFKIYDDDEDIEIEDVDFDDSDADVIVQARFEQDDIKYKATYNVEFKDGEVDDVDLVSIELR